MITLTQIRELILRQDKELEELILQYVSQSNKNYAKDYDKNTVKKEIEFEISNFNFEKAKSILSKNIDLFSNDSNLYEIKGTIALYENNLEEALDNFLKGLEIDCNNIDILYNMGYLNNLLGNTEESIYFYNKCLELTEDDKLKDELVNLINELYSKNTYTLIALDFDKNDEFFDSLDKENNNIINLILNKENNYENKYYENNMTICEVSDKNYFDMINYFIRRNENCFIIYRDFETKKILEKISNDINIIYYPQKNYYTNKSYYLNHSNIISKENENCNFANKIITTDINIYNHKKIIEKRNNIYFIDKDINSSLSLENILHNNYTKDLETTLKEYSKNIEDEYLKGLYVIASQVNNKDNCILLSKYLFETYNKEEVFYIYISLLKDNKDYNSLVSFIANCKFIDDAYKSEIIYLNAINKFELIDFIIDTITKNYNMLEKTSESYIDYKLALYSFELNLFENAYTYYLNVIEQDLFCNSVLSNKNLSYLMYFMGNSDFEKYYTSYQNLMHDYLSCFGVGD